MEPQQYHLPTLSKIDSKGKVRVWSKWVEDGTVYTKHGIIDGKLQTVNRAAKPLKNDSLSIHERARVIAKRDWIEALDKGYLPSEEEQLSPEFQEMVRNKAESGGNNHTLTGAKSSLGKELKRPSRAEVVASTVYLPNAAKVYEYKDSCRRYFDWTAGVHCQPKLDGERCVAHLEGDKVILSTRKGKQFVHLNHIRYGIEAVLQHSPNVVLDGELYFHDKTVPAQVLDQETDGAKRIELGVNQKFQLISSCCRTVRTNPHPHEQLIQFHVFDVVDPSLSQKERWELLQQLHPEFEEMEEVRLIPCKLVYSEEEAQEQFADYLGQGYEGCILRAHDLPYRQGKRENKMRKMKELHDEDYEIVGAEQAEGTQKGCVVWICCNSAGARFNSSMEGELEFKRRMYQEREQHIGHMLKIRHQGLTADGVPRFPVGVGVREKE